MSGPAPVPDGFLPDPRSSPLLDLLGPAFQSWVPGAPLALGLRVETRHLNSRGMLHGGVVATLGDAALGRAIGIAADPPVAMVTVTLTTHFVGRVVAGEWLEVAATTVRLSRTMAFVQGQARCGDRVVALLDAVFKAPQAPAGGTSPGSALP